MLPRFDFGDEVRVLRNLRNDGTFPGTPTGTLLVRRGSTGFVRDVGTFLQDQIIYAVHFLDAGRMVGCREEELQPADAPWTPSRFETRERVSTRVSLGCGGEVVVKRGEIGEVVRVIRDEPDTEVSYHVYFHGREPLEVPESALDPAPDASSGETTT